MSRVLGPVFWCGPVDQCATCQRALIDEPGFGDVEVPGTGGAWGLLCLACCAGTRVRWGWGAGHQYVRRPGGRWVLRRGLR